MVTLAMLYVGRGLGLLISQTRAMNLPESFLELANARFWGLPLPVLVFGMVVLVSHTVLTRTAFGRQVYAVGSDREAAEKAGIHTGFVLTGVYVICALYAAGGGIIAVAQIGAVTPGFGEQREFLAIAAVVLGGTSVFGGRGAVFPGTVLGAILIQAIENGLVLINADPYIYPLITSAVIFLAVAVDSFRHGFLQQLTRRRIRLEAEA